MREVYVRMLLATLLTCAMIGVSNGQAGSSSLSKVKLADLSFISGPWQAEWSGGLGEERWSVPSGDNMIGTFRFVKGGKARFYELMLIEQTDTGLVLRLKHFNPGLIGWEEKAQVYSYGLIEYRENMAVFELDDKKSRLTFRRISTDALSVLLEQNTNGKQNSEEFKFKLIK